MPETLTGGPARGAAPARRVCAAASFRLSVLSYRRLCESHSQHERSSELSVTSCTSPDGYAFTT